MGLEIITKLWRYLLTKAYYFYMWQAPLFLFCNSLDVYANKVNRLKSERIILFILFNGWGYLTNVRFIVCQSLCLCEHFYWNVSAQFCNGLLTKKEADFGTWVWHAGSAVTFAITNWMGTSSKLSAEQFKELKGALLPRQYFLRKEKRATAWRQCDQIKITKCP